jgi:hypothetical protein
VVATGQVIDTTKTINTWELKHNYTRFEEVSLDTNMHQLQKEYNPALQQGFSYEYLGILGHALNNVDFFSRPETDVFLFGRAWDPYFKTADRTIFFNTKTPFTSISYSTNIFINQAPEENIEAIHTQNFSPYTNFGIYFNILSGKEFYTNQKTRVNRVGLFGSHAKDRYSIFGSFYSNGFKVSDNGGLVDLDGFKNDVLDEPWLYEVNLEKAKTEYRNMSLFLTQKYNLVERQTFTDSLGNTTTSGKTLSLSHQLLVERNMKNYYDEVNLEELSPVYNNYYYYSSIAKDSASEDKISNVFQVILGDPDYDKLSARVYAGYEVRRFGMLSPDAYSYWQVDTTNFDPMEVDSSYRDTAVARFNEQYYHDVYIGVHLAGPTTGVWDWVVDGKYYLLGYYQNNFNVNATFSREIMGKANLGLRGSVELTRPHYFTNHYSSSFFRWENDFPSMFRIKGEAFVNSQELEMDIRAGVAYISNYVYWDQEAIPRVYDSDLMILSGYLSKHFKLSGWHSENKILFQYSTESDVLRLPLMTIYTSNYWKQSLFKGALITDLGFDLYYATNYRASAYMPATGTFHLQDERQIGGYPFLDAFISFRISRTRIFASINNILAGADFLGNNYFTTYRYPTKPRNFRLGLVWTFYD